VAIAQVKSIPGVSLGNERSFPWVGLTVTFGLMFLAGQWMAWRQLALHGFTVAANASSSFVYLLTAAHAIHLMGGLAVLFYAAAISSLRKPIESRMIMLDVTAWYWHVMLALWVYVFALLWIGR
jgi:cytochrome c oxidase subunit 3